MNVLAAVRQTAAAVFEIPEVALSDEATPESVAQWDSLRQLYLVLALEERFGVTFSPEEIERITSLRAVAQLLEGKLEEGAAAR